MLMRDVRKVFNKGRANEVEILHGIDLTLERQDFCAVVGPSGSGKSTLLNIVGLLDRPTSGSLRIGGEETTALNERDRTRLRGHSIGFVFQYHHLLSAFSALENVMMPMLADSRFATEAMRKRAEQLLDSVDLAPQRNQLTGNLSGGQQQRVAVARALAMQPALLLADEPTGNLDSKSADTVFELLQSVSRDHGMAVLFVTHNAALAARCNRTIQVVDGAILVSQQISERLAPAAASTTA
jgi:lipoprotein-releasing system ATP-binding protein